MENIEDLLKFGIFVKLEWEDVLPSIDKYGKEGFSLVKMISTVHDCIGMSKMSAKRRGFSINLKDSEYLQDFIEVNSAKVYDGE